MSDAVNDYDDPDIETDAIGPVRTAFVWICLIGMALGFALAIIGP